MILVVRVYFTERETFSRIVFSGTIRIRYDPRMSDEQKASFRFWPYTGAVPNLPNFQMFYKRKKWVIIESLPSNGKN